MKIVFQIIRNHASSPIPAVIISFDRAKYIFNIPETLQRFLKFHHFKMSKNSRIFLTRLSTDTITGMFGFLLTMFETNVCLETKIYGPKDLIEYIDSIKFLMGFKLLPYSCYDFNPFSKRKEENTLLGLKRMETINALVNSKTYLQDFFNIPGFIERELKNNVNEINDASEFISFQENMYKDENITVIPLICQQKSSASSNSQDVISYICITKRPESKINKEKLSAFNLNKVQLADLFKKGEIQLQNGTTLKKEDLQEVLPPSSVLIIIDCPTKEILLSLEEIPVLQSFTKKLIKSADFHLQAMIHMCEGKLVREQPYQEFMDKFECEHVFTSDEFYKLQPNDSKRIVLNEKFKYVHMVSTFYHYFPDHFPNILLNFSLHNQFFKNFAEITKFHYARYDIDETFKGFPRKSIAKTNHHYHLAPIKPGSEEIQADNNIKKKNSFQESAEFSQLFTQFLNAKQKFESSSKKLKYLLFSTCDPEIVFLGTGSMIPSNYRNVSCIFLGYPSFNMLLDCGEGSYFQLLNHFNYEKVREVLIKLRVIFITHIHVDHHAGIFQIIYQRNKILRAMGINPKEKPLFLVIPSNLAPWYSKYARFVEDLDGVCMVLSQKLSLEETNPNENYSFSKNFMYTSESMELEYYEDPLLKPLLEAIQGNTNANLIEFKRFLLENEIKEFLPILVDHCPQAHGIVITHNSGVKIVYSGDTRPCSNLVKFGADATVLIHEATYNDALADKAHENMHSTVNEAVDVARKMNAWRLILTHFSQRYSKHGLRKEEENGIKEKNALYYEYLKNSTVFAYDHLQGRVSELEYLPWLSHCMAEMFSEKDDE